MAVQYRDPKLFFDHYPDMHATDQAWAFGADAIWSTFEATGLPEEELDILLLTYAIDINQYSIISVDAEGRALVRLLGGRRTIMRDDVDEDLIQHYDQAQKALANASPRKADQSPKSPSAERAREHFLKQRQANSPAPKEG